ncbi:MAG: DotU family type IV/VI secretion system protein [Bdellovibrionales bacterium]|nr:DotU family type IV/VI secretion system protein [Bdellovibrionales bacterium]
MMTMSGKNEGHFSGTLLSLQLQLKTLFEGAGGDQVVELLDALSELRLSEQAVLLEVFTAVANRVFRGEQRLETEGDLARQQFEDGLYAEILKAMREAAHPESSNAKLTVVDGGKTATSRSSTIDINQARRTRRFSNKPLIN